MQQTTSTPSITSTYYQSPLGLLRIGGTDTYISEISFLDSLDVTERGGSFDLQGPIPPMVIQCIEQLIQYFQGQRRVFDFPVHQEGSPFQQKVWTELNAIPFGKTLSYLDMARRLGDTKTIRAAASANGKNHVAIVVPCHRVVGRNGKLTGYAGGLARKRHLLDFDDVLSRCAEPGTLAALA